MSGSTQLTPVQFRAVLTEFNDTTAYPDPAVEYWLADAYNNMNAPRWGQNLNKGALFYTAHYLVIGARNAGAARRGGIPGQVSGPLSSKGAGGVSGSFSTGAVVDPKAGQWNQTTYGIEYWKLLLQAGSGGLQVTGTILDCGGGWDENGFPWNAGL
jgi:hypothetical protein